MFSAESFSNFSIEKRAYSPSPEDLKDQLRLLQEWKPFPTKDGNRTDRKGIPYSELHNNL